MNDSIEFKKGDKVVCIDNNLIENGLTIGKIYDVLAYFFSDIKFKGEFYSIIEIKDDKEWCDREYYSCRRFVSLKEYRKLKLEKLKSLYD